MNYSEFLGEEMAEEFGCRDWAPEAMAMSDAVLPVVARGNNAVIVTPPTTAYAGPILTGILQHLREGSGCRGLVLVPNGQVADWAAEASRATIYLAVESGDGQARAARALANGSTDVLVTTLPNAIALQQRATLKVDALRSVVLAWPELWEDEAALATLMTDAKEAQRVIITTDPAAVAELVERYARKAMTFGAPAHDASPALPLGPVRTVSVTESNRGQAVRSIMETLDPASVAVWALNAESLGDAVDAAHSGGLFPENETGDVASAKVVIAWDLPTRARLEQLIGAGEVILLLPPHAEPWAARNLRDRRPLRVASAVDAARDEASRRRNQVSDALAAGLPTKGLLSLAPLFDRYEPTVVAAALYELWVAQAAAIPVAVQATMASKAPVETATMWISAGSADGLLPKDIVGALVNEIKVDRAHIGKVDVKEKFSLVELPAADVARISQAFTGTTLKRKRVLARPDRGRTERPAGPRGERPARSGPRTERPPRKRD